MNPLLFSVIALAGGVGAVARLCTDTAIRRWSGKKYPLGTLVINVLGSFLLGLVFGLSSALVLSEQWRLILGIGFLGGYTTFSTVSLETVQLVRKGSYGLALFHTGGMLVLAVFVASCGFWLSSLFSVAAQH